MCVQQVRHTYIETFHFLCCTKRSSHHILQQHCGRGFRERYRNSCKRLHRNDAESSKVCHPLCLGIFGKNERDFNCVHVNSSYDIRTSLVLLMIDRHLRRQNNSSPTILQYIHDTEKVGNVLHNVLTHSRKAIMTVRYD